MTTPITAELLARIDPNVVRLVPYTFARQRGAIAAHESEGVLQVWLRHDADPASLSEIRRISGKPISATLLSASGFDAALARAYASGTREGSAAEAVAENINETLDLSKLTAEFREITDLLEAENDAPIIKLVNAVLTEALKSNASDIHFEIFEGRSAVRMRVDGELRSTIELKRALHAAVISRLKVMAGLDIAEKRLPQDGRMSLKVAGRAVDVRVSTLPTVNGERVVLRLLDKQAGRIALSSLGMPPALREAFGSLVAAPHGIVLVTGPTGSGKTTTLYAALSELDRTRINIMTVEDPVEYELDGIGQTPVNTRIDMGFDRALRSILRQDPDVIMIGEIRDLETAQIAVQASLTGHLVLATLHTNDAPSAITRLMDMGIEPYLLASSLLGVVGQRLVRKLCTDCRHPLEGGGYEARGCPSCSWTGYVGRTGIYELMVVDETAKRMIHDSGAEADLRAHVLSVGMVPMIEDGLLRLVSASVTTREEVLRATRA
jgi:general secretion pathway protein E